MSRKGIAMRALIFALLQVRETLLSDQIAVRNGEPNKETKFALNYFNVEAPELINGVEEGQEVILVDHNEFAQSADGIEKAKIKMVVDHHRVYGFETAEPLYYRAEAVGCTETVMYKLYKENGFCECRIRYNIKAFPYEALHPTLQKGMQVEYQIQFYSRFLPVCLSGMPHGHKPLTRLR